MKVMNVCLVMITIVMAACSGGRQSNLSELMQEEVRFETYQMPDDLLASERELKLSELADSVWYVPLETKPVFWVRIYTPFLCFLSREYPLVFVGELVWWCIQGQ